MKTAIMAKKKESVIAQYEKMHKTANLVVDTALYHAPRAYQAATEKHLMNKEGQVDYERLNDSTTAKKFANTLVDKEIEDIKKELKLKKIKPEHEASLLSGFKGLARHQLQQEIADTGSDYTLQQHQTSRTRYYEQQARPLMYQNAAAKTGLKEKGNIEAIIKKTGVGEKVDAQQMTPEQAHELLMEHLRDGRVSDKYLKRQTFFKKPKKKS